MHIDQDPWQIGKNYPVEVGLIGDLKVGLAELGEILHQSMTPSQADGAKKRAAAIGDTHHRARAALVEEAKGQRAMRPLTPLTLMSSVARVLPPKCRRR